MPYKAWYLRWQLVVDTAVRQHVVRVRSAGFLHLISDTMFMIPETELFDPAFIQSTAFIEILYRADSVPLAHVRFVGQRMTVLQIMWSHHESFGLLPIPAHIRHAIRLAPGIGRRVLCDCLPDLSNWFFCKKLDIRRVNEDLILFLDARHHHGPQGTVAGPVGHWVRKGQRAD